MYGVDMSGKSNRRAATGGTPGTISGTELAGATEVTVDGVPVPFTQVSDTEITFVTPPHAAGEVEVVVTTPGRFMMSAAVSDSMIRKLARVYIRSPRSVGFVAFSPTGGRRTRSTFSPDAEISGRLSGRAPVAPFRR